LREFIISLFNTVAVIVIGLGLITVATLFVLWLRFFFGRLRDDRIWRKIKSSTTKIDVSFVAEVSVLPLFEWNTVSGKYHGNAGVSYLLEIDGKKVLFDLGDNPGRLRPSPLYHNMKVAGFEPDQLIAELSALVLSHHHPEHIGGGKLFNGREPNFDISLENVTTYKPWNGTTEGISPGEILPGVALSAPLPGRTFLSGRIWEWMMLIHLADKGLVCVAGDAHPDPIRMLLHASALTGIKPYAYVGGLHALLPDALGLYGQLRIGQRPPWKRREPEEIGLLAVGLQELGVKKLYLSGHDSDEMSLGIIQTVYGDDMRVLQVGEKIVVG